MTGGDPIRPGIIDVLRKRKMIRYKRDEKTMSMILVYASQGEVDQAEKLNQEENRRKTNDAIAQKARREILWCNAIRRACERHQPIEKLIDLMRRFERTGFNEDPPIDVTSGSTQRTAALASE